MVASVLVFISLGRTPIRSRGNLIIAWLPWIHDGHVTFLTETLAFGTIAPRALVTVPDSVAPVSCARHGFEIRTTSSPPTTSLSPVI